MRLRTVRIQMSKTVGIKGCWMFSRRLLGKRKASLISLYMKRSCILWTAFMLFISYFSFLFEKMLQWKQGCWQTLQGLTHSSYFSRREGHQLQVHPSFASHQSEEPTLPKSLLKHRVTALWLCYRHHLSHLLFPPYSSLGLAEGLK